MSDAELQWFDAPEYPESHEYEAQYGSTNIPFPRAFWDGHPDPNSAEGQQSQVYHIHCPPPALDSTFVADTEMPFSSFNDLPDEDENMTWRFANADVVISLAPRETDDLCIPSEKLMARLPWFKSALSDRWSYPVQEAECSDTSRSIRLELVFEDSGSTHLVRKIKPTPWLERLNQDNEALCAMADQQDFKAFDDRCLNTAVVNNCGFYGTSESVGHRDNPIPDAYRRTIIESYNLFFAIVLDIPIDLSKMPLRPVEVRRDHTVLLLTMIDHIDYYGSIENERSALEAFIFSNPDAFTTYDVRNYPETYLRIAGILRSEKLFQLALVHAANQLFNHSGTVRTQKKTHCAGNRELDSMIRWAAAELHVNIQRAIGMLKPRQWAQSRWYIYSGYGSKPCSSPIWDEWLERRIRGWSTPRDFRPLMFQILDEEIDVRWMVEDFIRNHRGKEDVPSDLDQHVEYLVDDLEEFIKCRWWNVKWVLDPDRLGFDRDEELGGFNGIDFTGFCYPWMYAEPKQPPSQLTLLYDQAVHPNRRTRKPDYEEGSDDDG